MLASGTSATGRPTMVFLHFLGGSAGSWEPVERVLALRFRCRRLDLPGFGDSPHRDGRSVAAMADAVADALGGSMPERWLLAGHSMGAKVALELARRAEDGADARLRGLNGLVLAAGSPPAPEPMEETKRREMLGWFDGDDDERRQQADGYVRGNVGATLLPERHERVVADVLRAEKRAWRRWLTDGSREDLRERIGTIAMPVLVLAGAADAALGEVAQREHMLPHLSRHRFAVLAGMGHLLPIEAPVEVAERIAAFVVEFELGISVPVPDPAHMTARTRALLEAREREDDAAAAPEVVTARQLRTLRAVLHRVLPHDVPGLDLAMRIDASLAAGTGDGWRFDSLPADRDAYPLGLDTLDARARALGGTDYAGAGAAVQERVLREAADEADGPGPLEPHALSCWFQELRGDAARLFMSHPAVLRRIGCDASATGTDEQLIGFEGVRSVAPTGVAR